jgi:high-affinity nickel permease
MATLLAVVLLGFFLGMRHATDPDHVIAVTTIVSRERNMLYATLIGVFWGLGHTVTIFLVGSAIILLKLTIPPRIGLIMELLVGLMLISLGILNLSGFGEKAIEWVKTRFGHDLHSHRKAERLEPDSQHSHGDIGWVPQWKRLGRFHILRPLIVGVVHGLAGSAAVGLLVLTAISRPLWAAGYLLVFGLGTIVGMMLVTTAIALPFTYTLKHFARVNQGLAVASGVLSLSFGLFLCYQVGIVGGLFTSHPNWTPH